VAGGRNAATCRMTISLLKNKSGVARKLIVANEISFAAVLYSYRRATES